MRITRPRIVEMGHNHLMRYRGQGSNNVSDSFIPGQAEDERHTLTRKQLCERLSQADGRFDRMRTIEQDPGGSAQDFHTPLPAHVRQTLPYVLLRDRPALLLQLAHHRHGYRSIGSLMPTQQGELQVPEMLSKPIKMHPIAVAGRHVNVPLKITLRQEQRGLLVLTTSRKDLHDLRSLRCTDHATIRFNNTSLFASNGREGIA